MPDLSGFVVPPKNVYPPLGVAAAPSGTAVVSPPAPKRSFPKPIFYALAAVVLIVVLIVIGRYIFSLVGRGSGTTITWWGLWEDTTIIEPLIDEYQKKNPKVKIQYVKQSKEDYRERLTSALAKGEGPDIFRFHNTWVPMFKNDLDIIPASVMNASEFSQTFYPIAASDLTSGTGFAGIPLEYDGLGLYINEDILATAGKSAPSTWEDLRRLAIELTRKDADGVIIQSGVALGRTENVDHWPEILGLMMIQNGVNMVNPSGKLAEDAIVFFTLFSSNDEVWDTTLPSSTLAFSSGKLAMYFGPSWRAFEIKQQNPNLKFKVVPVPQLPKASYDEPDVGYASYWVEGVWSRAKNKDAAWDFLKLLSSKDSLEKFYQNAARVRGFGEPYPRVEMANLVATDPIVGAFITQAPGAQSWYLQSRTFDGPTGINSQINKYFENAVNAVNSGKEASEALVPAAAGVVQVLTQYGLLAK